VRLGIFDSGIGGLTVLAAMRRTLPGHDLVYLGDTARIPYGTRSPRTVLRYTLGVASYLHQLQVDALVIACNTATTHALTTLRAAGERVGVPVFGVVEPGVRQALRVHREGAVAVLGTEGTVAGGAYLRGLKAHAPDVTVASVACPLFVPLVEEGWTSGSVPEQVAETYVGHLRGKADTVILGCTHYPMLRDVIQTVLPDATLVDSAQATADYVLDHIGPGQGEGTITFLATDNIARFQKVGATILGRVPEPVEWVDLPAPSPPFAP
jgi:glutamate racemase